MGSNYDAAVLSAGHAGFALGATPNGIANMQSVSSKYAYSNIAFFVMPAVGALFIDLFNIPIISIFIYLLSQIVDKTTKISMNILIFWSFFKKNKPYG